MLARSHLPDVLGVIPVSNTEPQSVPSLCELWSHLQFAFAVTVPGLPLAPGPCGAPRRFAAVTALVDCGGRIARPLARVARLGRLRRGHRSGRLRWEGRVASYSDACLGLGAQQRWTGFFGRMKRHATLCTVLLVLLVGVAPRWALGRALLSSRLHRVS